MSLALTTTYENGIFGGVSITAGTPRPAARRGLPTTAPHGAACETGPQRPDCSGASACMGSYFSSISIRAGALGLAVPCLCLEESIKSPARSGIGLERSDMGLRQPRSVQMASKFGGMQPLPYPRAFTMALTGGAMEQGPLTPVSGSPAWWAPPRTI